VYSIKVGDVVLCRVVRVTVNVVATEIIAVNNVPTTLTKHSGSIRKEDIRLHDDDKYEMNDFFRLGDIVRAVVLSLGDAKQYFLSTAPAAYGTRFARSKAGNLMVPISWKVFALM
jgi:exosome complex component CSL4